VRNVRRSAGREETREDIKTQESRKQTQEHHREQREGGMKGKTRQYKRRPRGRAEEWNGELNQAKRGLSWLSMADGYHSITMY
jgi:hypothetical protein